MILFVFEAFLLFYFRVHILQLDVTNTKEINDAVEAVTLQVGEEGSYGVLTF